MFVTLLVFLAVLALLVYAHELGHFIAAKRNGVKVKEFAFGFKPRLFAKKIGETTYAINLLPFGGYVKMYGEQEDETETGSFKSKTIWQRFQILVAGSIMNLVLAWLILWGLFTVGFDPIVPGVNLNPLLTITPQISVAVVAQGSPAEAAGIMPGDVLVSLNDQKVTDELDFLTRARQLRGSEVILDIKRGDEILKFKVQSRLNPPEGQGAIGIGVNQLGEAKTSFLLAPIAALIETGRIIVVSIEGIGRFFGELILKQKVSEEVTGIIGIASLTGTASRLGFEYLLQLVAVVSVGLGLINLAPILPLDGGHITVLGYEKIAQRPLSEKYFGYLTAFGLALVLILFLSVTYKDVIRFDILGRFFS